MYDIGTLLQFFLSGIGVGCIYGLIGIGFCLTFNASGIINFAQGGFVMFGSMMTYLLLSTLQLPLPLAIAGSLVLAILLGLSVEFFVIRRLRNRDASLFVLILATLAVHILIEHAMLVIGGDQPRGLPAFTPADPIRFLGAAISVQLLWVVGCSLLLVFGLGLLYRHTLVGKAMRACAINAESASLLGISSNRMLLYAFGMAAAFGAAAGILVAPLQYTAFNIGIPFAISGFIAAVLGGLGHAGGAFIGGIVLGLLETVAIVMISGGYRSIVALSLLLVLLLVRPSGLFGSMVEH
jgi:branched-chain amino acid transport system permease protein